MTAGVYRIEFNSGKYYLGKSEDCEGRWRTHQKNFLQGTHTKKMQWEYLHHGEPTYTIELETHPDHCHIYEAILIDSNWGTQLLNTTRPKAPDYETSLEYLQIYERIKLDNEPVVWSSTLKICKALEQEHKTQLLWQDECTTLQQSLDDMQRLGVRMPDAVMIELELLEQEVAELKHQNQEYTQELQRLKSRSWWQRLWDRD